MKEDDKAPLEAVVTGSDFLTPAMASSQSTPFPLGTNGPDPNPKDRDASGTTTDFAAASVLGSSATDSKSSNMVGKINNLISTDLENITEGREFLMVLINAPVTIGGCIWFLYALLGWRLVHTSGLAVNHDWSER